MNIPSEKILREVYGDSHDNAARFRLLCEKFCKTFSDKSPEFFTAPGRAEIIGNHTDHNGGQVIAASIDMDTVGAAFPNGTNTVHIFSQGYRPKIAVDLSHPEAAGKHQTTPPLVAGMMEAVRKFGFKVSGFDAYISSNVIRAAGVSSSASFEMLVCTIVNHFFNDGAMSLTDYAKIGQYAENVYWNKASGLMDQMACAVGGAVFLDFSDQEKIGYKKMGLSFENAGYGILLINTGKNHADLSREYSEIPSEMRQIAAALGSNLLCDTDEEKLLSVFPDTGNDRALLRALHFFEENRRVNAAAKAIEKGNVPALMRLMERSGISSFEFLQNCYVTWDLRDQKIPLVLALTRHFLDRIGDGICRVHGGGFAGTIMCVLPKDREQEYIKYISKYVGAKNVYPLKIRNTGAVHLPI